VSPRPLVRLAPSPTGSGLCLARPAGWLGDTFGAYKAALDRAGARYEAKLKGQVLKIVAVPVAVRNLEAAGFAVEVDRALRDALAAHATEVRSDVQAAEERAAAVDAQLRARGLALFPFQRLGVGWLAPRKAAGLFDEMGLGKTIQALVAAPEGAPMLVVCPKVAKRNWVAEAARWRPDLRPVMLKGRNSFRWPEVGEMVVTNKDILTDDPGVAPEGAVVIADEAHVYKNPKARCTKRFRRLSQEARDRGGRVWLLTGTPLLGKEPELWNVLEAAGLARDAFGTWRRFSELVGLERGRWGMECTGRVSPELPEALRRVSLARRRTEVLPDLPTKLWRTVEVECVDADEGLRKLCDEVLAALREYAEKKGISLEEAIEEAMATKDGVTFDQLARVRHRLSIAKIPALLEMIEEREEEEQPVVVFSAHRAPVEALATRGGWGIVTGGAAAGQRADAVEMFQAGRLRGIAATIGAGGVAITLTRAHEAIFVDLDWTPALNAQAEDRVCRIGQTRGVIITRIQADHAIDEHVNRILARKQELIAATVEASAVLAPAASTELADELEAVARRAQETGAASSRPARREASTPVEMWAQRAIVALAAMDPDHAGVVNEMGFNKLDGSIGHSLANQLASGSGLTEKQWTLATAIARRYPRQVGRPPEEA